MKIFFHVYLYGILSYLYVHNIQSIYYVGKPSTEEKKSVSTHIIMLHAQNRASHKLEKKNAEEKKNKFARAYNGITKSEILKKEKNP